MAKKMYIYNLNWDKYIYIVMNIFLKQLKRITNISNHIDIQAAQSHIVSNIEFRGPNVWILILAVVIASVGLNVNSIPVVIGAMLISPLMGPIMGIGLALGINDTNLLKQSFKNLLIMTSISIFASFIFFLITPLALENPSELLARTNPTIYDVFIALCGGLAVIIEVCRKDKGTVIAGAAIATALMPPLCTAGYGIANGNFMYFIGAFYLYFINSVFIALATFLTVRYLHFPLVQFSDKEKQKRVHRTITIFTIILIIPSIYTAVVVINESRFNQNAKRFITENKNLPNSYIYDYHIEHGAGKHSSLTISIAGEALTEREIERLQERLSSYNITKDQLVVNQGSTYVANNISEGEVIKSIYEITEQEVIKRDAVIKNLENQLDSLKNKELPTDQIAKEVFAQYPQLSSITLTRGSKSNVKKGKNLTVQKVNDEQVLAFIKFSTPLTANELSKLRDWLSVRLDIPNIKIIEEK